MKTVKDMILEAALDKSIKGKRTVRRSVRGNLYGYIGSKKVEEFNGRDIDPFSPAEDRAAKAWLAGRDDWFDAAWE